MPRTLDVYLHSNLAGHLLQNDGGQTVFSYAANYSGLPLSHSLPVRKESFSHRECLGYFAGILPEGNKREIIARNLGISARNDFSMLEQIGGECAGAVTFMPSGQPLPERDYRYHTLSDQDLAGILKELPRRPLMAGEQGVRLSLAGAQDKLAVHVADNHISLPLGNAPSTHILKPAIEHLEGVVFNEALCMNLAKSVGLPAATVETRNVEGIDYLLVERYDRKEVPVYGISQGKSFFIPFYNKRLHQEDFCQAMGIAPENKYQSENGPSLKDCFSLLRDVSRAPIIDLQRFLDAVIFNFLLGNHDAHGKNFSFTYDEGTLLTGIDARLAPLYDIICTVYYPEFSLEMAMKIGGEYKSDLIFPRHFERLAEEAGLAKPLVKHRIAELAQSVIVGLERMDIRYSVARNVATLIRKRCEDTVVQFRN